MTRECEDAISRQAVIDATVKKNSIWNSITNSKGENLEEIISQLPPITPQPKIGHWVKNKDGNIYCSFCGCGALYDKVYPGESVFGKAIRVKSTFCPTCGAKMQEGKE